MKRGEVWLTLLDPTVGSEIRKTRPCLIVSPPEIHDHWRTTIVAPMTKGARLTRYRVPVNFQSEPGLILLDQIRALDKVRLIRCLGEVEAGVTADALTILRKMFAQ